MRGWNNQQTDSWRIRRKGFPKPFRVNKMRNRPHRFGSGKVHWVIYEPEWKVYYKACRSGTDLDFILGGEMNWGNVPKGEEITCGRCKKIKWLNG